MIVKNQDREFEIVAYSVLYMQILQVIWIINDHRDMYGIEKENTHGWFIILPI